MLKRFEVSLAAVVGMALTLVACQPPEQQPQSTEGEAQVVVRELSQYSIDRMVVTAQPANVTQTLDYNADAGTYSGRMVLPAGEQTLTAEGYSSSYVPDGGSTDGGSTDAGYTDAGYTDGGDTDAGYVDAGYSDGGYADVGSVDAGSDGGGSTRSTLVASGSATVTITAGGSTAVTLRIYDLTPPPAQGDIGPLIRSLKASSSTTTVGASTLFEVDAVDLDGDALSYSWTSTCMAGTFSSPFSAVTSWTSSTTGVCKVSVTVSSRKKSVTEFVEVTVFSAPVDGGPGEGSVQVIGEYIARPRISRLYFYGSGVPSTTLYRSSGNATLPNVQAGMTYSLEMYVDYGTRSGVFANDVESDCGGSWTKSWDNCSGSSMYCTASYSWTTPATPTACKLTLRASNGPLTDSYSVGVVVR